MLQNEKHSLKDTTPSDITQSELTVISTLNNEKLQKMLQQENQQECEYQVVLSEIYEHINHLSEYNYRKEYVHLLSIYYYNQAYISHKFNRLLSVETALENSLKNYECVRGFLTTREENIVHSGQLVKIYLQYCAILSQLGKHSLALLYAEKTLEKLIQCFRLLQALCYDQLCISQRNIYSDIFVSMEKICFRERVLTSAKKLLDQLSCLPEKYKLLEEEKNHYEKIMQEISWIFRSNIYYWRDNMDANEKIMKKELEIQKKKLDRNILGLPKTQKTIEDFSLGSLMNLQFKKVSFNPFKSERYLLLSIEKLRELILYSSIAYFIMGTQSRFNHIEEDIEQLNINEKYKKLNHDNEISKCKILHLKAIEIVGKYLPTCKNYFNHLLLSFNKNYKSVLDQIEQESSIFTSLEQSTKVQLSEPFHQYGMTATKASKFESEILPTISHKKNRVKHMREQKKEGKVK